MHNKSVILKEGKEKSLLQKHPWIFSGAVDRFPDFKNGEILSVLSSKKEFLAQAYFHRENSLCGRVLTFGKEDIAVVIKEKCAKALVLRKTLFSLSKTSGYRLINAEGDDLPGLIVDVYDKVLVMQISTCGMERLKTLIVEILVDLIKPIAIYEKSSSSSREKEGLEDAKGFIFGSSPDEIQFLENGHAFFLSLEQGQKTGFFLDQREMRKQIEQYSLGRRVLNCFSYTGGFSVYAMEGGAKLVDSVDISKSATELAKKNMNVNSPSAPHREIAEDVFTFLKSSSLEYDLVILDPPAFAKKMGDVNQACKGYKEINRSVLEKIPPNSFLLTSSCSYFIDKGLFQKLLFQAALEAKRNLKILSEHIQASDHPVSIYHPEGNYLKSLFVYIE